MEVAIPDCNESVIVKALVNGLILNIKLHVRFKVKTLRTLWRLKEMPMKQWYQTNIFIKMKGDEWEHDNKNWSTLRETSWRD